jgi:hypothetical protein
MRILLEDDDYKDIGLHKKFEDDNIVGHWRELKQLGFTEAFINYNTL